MKNKSIKISFNKQLIRNYYYTCRNTWYDSSGEHMLRIKIEHKRFYIKLICTK